MPLRFIPGLTVSIVTLFAAYLTGPVTIQFVVLTPLAVAANIVFYTLFKAPTPAGRRIMDEIDGFRQYLAVAEKDRLNLLNPPDETPGLFERYLPYALALGVEQRWSERFAGILSRAAAGDQG